ncbi:MAG: PBP1A family penicillin-binding protein [Calditrichae bacterium]|nr:PBP1A family penicillin-binding protein [Calditrichota bacterium]MCB9059573.1 PBP1A family penicillin-binding protein [Calditrichia bacterium]
MKRGQSSTTRIKTSQKTSVSNTAFKPAANKDTKKIILITSISSAFLLFVVLFFIFFIKDDLPSLDKLERIDPAVATQVYSSDGELLHTFFTSNRTYTPYERIPSSVVDALISTEDRSFYDHWGLDIYGIFRALIIDIIFFERQGASTITMQLSRNLYFGYEQTILRKIKEAITSIQIEKTYSKHEILEMYLNVNPFGNNTFGIQAAAKRYFNKNVEDLKVEESALLIGILKGQTFYSPIRHPDRALKRRNVVLSMMVANDKLTKAEFDSLKQIPMTLDLNDPNEMKTAPYFTEYVRRQLNSMQDSLGVNIYEDGLRVYTTLNNRFQHFMEKSVANHIDNLQESVRNQRDFRELKKTMSDSAFKELTRVEIAFVAINPHTGHILAMIGGRDFNKSKFNRVTQAKRQPGSAFKPFLYTAAIDNGFSPADQYLNQPTVEINPDGTRWTPENYDKSVGGLTTLREAMYRSLNLVAVRLINDVNPRNVAKYAKAMGITTQVRPFSSLALGSSEVIPLEIVSAYGVFANNGLLVKPIAIAKIEDKNGNVIYQKSPESQEVLSPETTHIVRDMMQDVIRRGTGYAVRRDYNFMVPAGGKTGTTNDYTNAWFIGYTPDIAAGVWVGLDDANQSLGPGMTGTRAALPFWGEFMSSVYDSVNFIRNNFVESPGVFEVEICLDSKKEAGAYCPNTRKELFTAKNRPTEVCDIHGGYESVKKQRKRRF